MKFTQITNELFGAMNAGYHIDFTTERQYDNTVYQDILKNRGETYLSNYIDGFCDFEGDLYQGDDGQMYVVGYDYIRENGIEKYVPVVWHRVIKDS